MRAEVDFGELSPHCPSRTGITLDLLTRSTKVILGAPGFWMVLVGLLWRPRAGACPNLPQRRPGPGSAAKKSAEYQRFFSRAPARSGPLWQIWTTLAAADPREPPGRAPRTVRWPGQASGRVVPGRATTTTGTPASEQGPQATETASPDDPPPAPKRALRTRKCSSNRHSRVQNAPLDEEAGRPQPPRTATTTPRSTTAPTSRPPLLARKAQCELSLPKSTSARFVRAQLAQCELR